MAWSTQNVWWRNSSAPGTFSGLFPRVRAYADPKPLPQAGGVRHRYTRTPPPRHSPGWLGGTLRAGPGPLIDPNGAHGGLGPTPPIPPLGHPTRHPLLVIWLRKRRLAGHPKNVLKNAAPRFDLPRLQTQCQVRCWLFEGSQTYRLAIFHHQIKLPYIPFYVNVGHLCALCILYVHMTLWCFGLAPHTHTQNAC